MLDHHEALQVSSLFLLILKFLKVGWFVLKFLLGFLRNAYSLMRKIKKNHGQHRCFWFFLQSFSSFPYLFKQQTPIITKPSLNKQIPRTWISFLLKNDNDWFHRLGKEKQISSLIVHVEEVMWLLPSGFPYSHVLFPSLSLSPLYCFTAFGVRRTEWKEKWWSCFIVGGAIIVICMWSLLAILG